MGGHELVIKNRRHGKNTASKTLMKLLTLLNKIRFTKFENHSCYKKKKKKDLKLKKIELFIFSFTVSDTRHIIS